MSLFIHRCIGPGSLLFALWLAIGGMPPHLQASSAQIDFVLTTFHKGSEQDLREAIDGVDVGRHGWSVAPHTDQPQAAIFGLGSALDSPTVDVTLCFLSGKPNSYPHEFTISATVDPRPSFAGNWQRLLPTRINATGPDLALGADGRLRAGDSAADAVFQLTLPLDKLRITGFRIDVFPGKAVAGLALPRVAGAPDGDFTLTEFRVEATAPRTTNIALGRPVIASEETRFPAEALTDGLPGTFSHPGRPNAGKSFYFQIDLGAVHDLDHIALRNRGDGNSPDRISRLKIEIADDPPGLAAAPVWTGEDRADGTHPAPGEVDIVRAANGRGKFAGRFLRLSSDSQIAFSPQLAEVEVYEVLRLEVANVSADGVALPGSGAYRVPAGSRRWEVALNPAPASLPEGLPCRWRLRGEPSDWQQTTRFVIAGPCPPPGQYVFQAQLRQTDGEWSSALLEVPLEVRAYPWQTRAFRFSLAALAVLALAFLVRSLTQRRLARQMASLEARAALDGERARIARDMHDEVGSRLAQLAIRHDLFAREPSLPDDARSGLRELALATRRVIAALDEVVWAVNPGNDTLASLAGYLEQCAVDYLAPVEIACRIDAPFEWPNVEVRARVRHHLVLALREALQNILKHAGATEVTLTLRLEPAGFLVRLADNGRGLAGRHDAPGQDGLDNMRARMAAVGGRCEVRARPSGGTEVEMRAEVGHAGKVMEP